MQTYSHFIITAALADPLKKRAEAPDLPKLERGALLLGSIAPDLPLTLITIGCVMYDMANSTLGADESVVRALFRDWFFNSPWVKAAHNLFHSPLLDVLYILFGYWLWKRAGKGGGKRGAWIFWFAVSCLLHTSIDIPVHYDDGPLLLFPLNWSWRFISPVSYWDPQRYGTPFAIVEHTLILGLLIYLLATNRLAIGRWLRAKFSTPSDK